MLLSDTLSSMAASRTSSEEETRQERELRCPRAVQTADHIIALHGCKGFSWKRRIALHAVTFPSSMREHVEHEQHHRFLSLVTGVQGRKTWRGLVARMPERGGCRTHSDTQELRARPGDKRALRVEQQRTICGGRTIFHKGMVDSPATRGRPEGRMPVTGTTGAKPWTREVPTARHVVVLWRLTGVATMRNCTGETEVTLAQRTPMRCGTLPYRDGERLLTGVRRGQRSAYGNCPRGTGKGSAEKK